MSRSPFLTAVWSNLCLVTYALEPDVLRDRLPPELELDTLDGNAFASLVAFDFLDTRVKGIAWPGFRNFPEINLRFYVREKASGRRGVMFVRELVPGALVAWIARTLYNEPYAATPMESSVERSSERVTVDHHWLWRGHEHRLTVTSRPSASLPNADSLEHFFKEHQWGYGVTRRDQTLIYEVRHPHWETHVVTDCSVDVDFGQLYGPQFAHLTEDTPVSVVHAVGSPIEVHGHAPLSIG